MYQLFILNKRGYIEFRTRYLQSEKGMEDKSFDGK